MSDAPPTLAGSSRGRLTMIATGSRGDIQPQVALARRLTREGWQVRFATHRCFAGLAAAGGLEIHPLSGDSERFFSGPAGVAFRERLGDRAKATDLCRRFLTPFVRGFLGECFAACQGTDTILYWPPSQVGPSLAEALGVPCFGVATYPLPHCRTSAFVNPFAEPLGPALARATQAPGVRGRIARSLTWSLGEPVWRQVFREEVGRWRVETLSLPRESDARSRRRLAELPHLLGFSPLVLPPPKDWPRHLHATGYWFLDLAQDWTPPPELEAFLAGGEPPLAIGFGSMVSRDPAATTAAVLEAVRRAGVRAVLLTGWGGLRRGQLGEKLLPIKDVPHDWLFARVSGLVHHGGSGTTAAGLRAGKPALIVPFGFDQFLWGRRLAELGVGPEPIPCATLTAEALAPALRRLADDEELRRRAADLGERIRAEDGAGVAAEIVTRAFRSAA